MLCNLQLRGVLLIWIISKTGGSGLDIFSRLLLLCICKVMSGLSVNLTTLFLGRLRPLKLLTSISCTYFRE